MIGSLRAWTVDALPGSEEVELFRVPVKGGQCCSGEVSYVATSIGKKGSCYVASGKILYCGVSKGPVVSGTSREQQDGDDRLHLIKGEEPGSPLLCFGFVRTHPNELAVLVSVRHGPVDRGGACVTFSLLSDDVVEVSDRARPLENEVPK